MFGDNRENIARMAFFDAMITTGWTGSRPKILHSEAMPGFKETVYDGLYEETREVKVIDRWSERSHSKWSSGTTTIWIDGEPYWCMHYGGWYERQVLDFLKKTLREMYTARYFYGGRAASLLRGETYLYTNLADFADDFTMARGVETIYEIQEVALVGEHWYRCQLC